VKGDIVHAFEVRNDELTAALDQMLMEQGVTDAVLVSKIGVVDDFAILTTPSDNPDEHRRTVYDKPGEIAGAVGEVRAGKLHLHVTFGVDYGQAIAGHLDSATIGQHFARAFFQELT
jgi:predicted DNA-binding protein with PD1-like motif